ncbi:MAG: hypothetical protein JSW73_03240 [Candidatus Woesearchaeota archaeon]|nr:MAG: hypothetical protein JSW73_03240 [Candidatus Woesearchaeota archaeon]
MVETNYNPLKNKEVGTIEIKVETTPFGHPKDRCAFIIKNKDLKKDHIYHIRISRIADPQPLSPQTVEYIGKNIIRQEYGEEAIYIHQSYRYVPLKKGISNLEGNLTLQGLLIKEKDDGRNKRDFDK